MTTYSVEEALGSLWIMSAADEQALFAQNEARVRRLYGRQYDDMLFLRRAGFWVWRDGDLFVVDCRPITKRQFIALARRERRLREESN